MYRISPCLAGVMGVCIIGSHEVKGPRSGIYVIYHGISAKSRVKNRFSYFYPGKSLIHHQARPYLNFDLSVQYYTKRSSEKIIWRLQGNSRMWRFRKDRHSLASGLTKRRL